MKQIGRFGIRRGLGALAALSVLLLLGGCEMEVLGYTAEGYFGATPEAKLAVAAGKGDVKEVRRLVRAGADVNRAGAQNFTPLGWALMQRNVAGMRALLEAGADPNQRIGPNHELHLVWLAAAMEPSSILEVLLKFKGDANATNDDSLFYVALARTNLSGLSQAARLQNVKLLVEAGADINVTDIVGTPYIVDAAGATWYDVVLYALDHGYDHDLPLLAFEVHRRRPDGKAPLPDHVERERLPVVEKLRQMGVVTPEKPPSLKPPRRPPGLTAAPVKP